MKFSTWLNGITADGSPDTAADYLVTYDADAATSKKVLIDTIITASGGITESGWVAAGETWTYASADDPTYTFTIAGVDKTTKYYPGMRVRLSQSTGGTKYFIITKVAFSTDTTVTIYGGTDYNLENEAISSPNYSVVKAPTGFPLEPTKWTVEATDTTLRTQATPVQDTWYNLGSVTISIPIGAWRVYYQVTLQISDASSSTWTGFATLSTANNSESDTQFTSLIGAASITLLYQSVTREKNLVLSSKTSYFLNTKTNVTGLDNIHNRNDLVPLVIRAVSAYL